MIVDGHGCHTALNFGVKAREKIKTKFLRYTGYLNSIEIPIKQDLLLILALVRQQSFLNCKPRVLKLLKHVIKYCEQVYERSHKNYLGLLKIQVKF